MTQRPELRVGQIWLLRKQTRRVKVVRIDEANGEFCIQYMQNGASNDGSTWTRYICNYDGVGYASPEGAYETVMTTLVYDPTDSTN